MRSSLVALSASGTARSGRCVVASATRSDLPASSITGCSTPVRLARNSVWPENSKPDWVITLFWTGAVTSACAACALHSATPRRSMSSTYAAFATSRRPATTGVRSAIGITCKLPTRCGPTCAAVAHSRSVTRAARARDRSANRLGSPSTASRAGISRCASARQMSGPMPAGSPELTTTTGRSVLTIAFEAGFVGARRSSGAASSGRGRGGLETDLDERLVAQAPQP